QAGLFGAPPIEATTTRSSPSFEYTTGTECSSPVFAPFVVRTRTSRPTNGPLVGWPFARTSAMRSSLNASSQEPRKTRAYSDALSDELAEDRLGEEAE